MAQFLVAGSEDEAILIRDGKLFVRTPEDERPVDYEPGDDIDAFATSCFKWQMWRVVGPDGFYPEAPPEGLPELAFTHTQEGEPVFSTTESKSIRKCDGCEGILDVPDIRQSTNYDCGPSAAMSVCKFFGVGPDDEQEYVSAMGTTPQDGTPPDVINQYLKAVGLDTVPQEGMTIDDLKENVDAGNPVICAIQDYGTPEEEATEQSGHWVVVIGVQDDFVILQDPSAGRVTMPAREFQERWHDRDS